MQVYTWIYVTLALSVFGLLLQVAGFAAPMWVWLDVDSFRVGVGLWHTVGCGVDGTCNTATPTVAFGYSAADTWQTPQFRGVQGLQTVAVAGAVLLVLFLAVYAFGYDNWTQGLGTLNMAAFVTCVLTWLCILAGLILFCAYYWPVVGTSPLLTPESFPWSLLLCFGAGVVFVVVCVLIRVKCRERGFSKHAIPMSGDSKMELNPVTKMGLTHRYFTPLHYNEERRGKHAVISENAMVTRVNKSLIAPEERHVTAIDNVAFAGNHQSGLANGVLYRSIPVSSGALANSETVVRRSLPAAVVTYNTDVTEHNAARLAETSQFDVNRLGAARRGDEIRRLELSHAGNDRDASRFDVINARDDLNAGHLVAENYRLDDNRHDVNYRLDDNRHDANYRFDDNRHDANYRFDDNRHDVNYRLQGNHDDSKYHVKDRRMGMNQLDVSRLEDNRLDMNHVDTNRLDLNGHRADDLRLSTGRYEVSGADGVNRFDVGGFQQQGTDHMTQTRGSTLYTTTGGARVVDMDRLVGSTKIPVSYQNGGVMTKDMNISTIYNKSHHHQQHDNHNYSSHHNQQPSSYRMSRESVLFRDDRPGLVVGGVGGQRRTGTATMAGLDSETGLRTSHLLAEHAIDSRFTTEGRLMADRDFGMVAEARRSGGGGGFAARQGYLQYTTHTLAPLSTPAFPVEGSVKLYDPTYIYRPYSEVQIY